MPKKTTETKGAKFSTKIESEFEMQQSFARILLGIIAIAIFMIFILGRKALLL